MTFESAEYAQVGLMLRQAGRRIRNTLGAAARSKGEVDFVTETDLAVEAEIRQWLTDRYPEDALLAEEGGSSGTGARRWILDPVDGTTNFAHGLPHASISLALEDEQGLLAGWVYDPFREELFSALRGRGAQLNGQPIGVSRTGRLADALIVSGFPYDRRERVDFYLARVRAFLMACHGFRRFGSAALDLAWVAAGRIDGYWEYNLHPWDVAAGLLLVREAGGRATGPEGQPAGLRDPLFVVSNGPIHAEIEALLRSVARSEFAS